MVFLLLKRWQAVGFPVTTEKLSTKNKTKHHIRNLQRGIYSFVAVEVNFFIESVLAKMRIITMFMVGAFVTTLSISLKLLM
jgi:hypothetical protein